MTVASHHTAEGAGGERPYIVGIGGTTRCGSSTERVLRAALSLAEASGAEVELFSADRLDLPMYAPERPERTPAARELIEALRRADGVIISSPGYHGGMSGLIKNVLDYIEDMRTDAQPYLDGRPVGLIVCAHGWQATSTTLTGLRAVTHALRGWPTPFGVTVNSAEQIFSEDGTLAETLIQQLQLLIDQVLGFIRVMRRAVAEREVQPT